MLVRFLLFGLLVLLLLRALWRFLVGVVDGASRLPRSSKSSPPAKGVPMARDPICGTFVVPARALTLSAGGEVHYFCSEECRESYRTGARGRQPAPR